MNSGLSFACQWLFQPVTRRVVYESISRILRHGAAEQILVPSRGSSEVQMKRPLLASPAQGMEKCSFINAYQRLIIPMNLIVLLTCGLVLIYQQGWITHSLFCIIAPSRTSEISSHLLRLVQKEPRKCTMKPGSSIPI